MNVLITGGAGFIGYHLARFHVARGDSVFLVDDFSKTAGKTDEEFMELAQHPYVNVLEVDLREPLIDLEWPVTLDLIYHLAAINGTRLFYEHPYHVARTNLLVTLNLLDLLKRRGTQVGRLVYSSTSEVYAGAEPLHLLQIPTDERAPVVFPQPTPVRFSYGTSKFMGEFLCVHFGKEFHVPCTVVRYHNIYGPRMGQWHVIPEFIERIRQGTDPFEIYGGHETRAFCYVDDAVKATYLVATTPACADEIIHIGNPRETKIRDLATRLMSLMGHEVVLQERGSREGSVSRRCPDTTKLRMLTGFEAEVELRDGLERTIEWYLAHA